MQGVDVDDGDLALAASRARWSSRRPTSRPRIEVADAARPRPRRRSKAATVPGGRRPRRPRRSTSARDRSGLDERRRSVSTRAALDARSRDRATCPRRAPAASCASTRSTTNASWLLRPRRPRTGSAAGARARTRAASRRTPCTPCCRLPVSGRRSREPRAHGRQELHAVERAPRAGRASRTRSRASVASGRAFGWSRNSRSSPLTLKTSACVLAAWSAEGAAREQAVEQEASRRSSWWRRRRCPRC